MSNYQYQDGSAMNFIDNRNKLFADENNEVEGQSHDNMAQYYPPPPGSDPTQNLPSYPNLPPSGHLPSQDLMKAHPMYEESKIPHVPAPTVEQSGPPAPVAQPGQPGVPPPDPHRSDLVGGFLPGASSLSIASIRKTGGMTSHMEYQIKGQDNAGNFQIYKRYSEFHQFFQSLTTRWPGLYIPPIPPKKPIGNMDQKFIEERRHFLDRYLKELVKIPYLATCDEFKIFCRNPLNYEKALHSLERQNYQNILEKYRRVLPVAESTYTPEMMAGEVQELGKFLEFAKKALQSLEHMKSVLKQMMPMMAGESTNYFTFCELLCKYEEASITEFSNQHVNGVLKNSPAMADIKFLKTKIANPFKEMYYWVKGEVYDLRQIIATLKNRVGLEELKVKMEKKRADDKTSLQKLQSGKKTFKTLFKSSATEINNLNLHIQNYDRDIASLEVIIKLVTIYLTRISIPSFKKEKLSSYLVLLKKYSTNQVEQANMMLQIWQGVKNSHHLTNVNHFAPPNDA